MCVDYTDLNKACPKDSFPLPKIDQLVDSTIGHALLSIMMPNPVSNKSGWGQKIKKKLRS